MPRSIRKKSKTGIYHVMLRGINRQDIFEDEEDYVNTESPVHLEIIQLIYKFANIYG